MRALLYALVTMLALAVCACGPKTIPDRPSRPLFEDKLIDVLAAKYSDNATTADRIDKIATKEDRNQCIDELLYITDVAFYNYSCALTMGKALMDTYFDMGIIGLGAAGAISTTSHIQTILAASSAAVAGTRASIDKNFFDENGMDAIVAVMRASRTEILVEIRKKTAKTFEEYSMKHALCDITAYNAAGSVPHALAVIQKESGKKEDASEQILKKFNEDVATKKQIFKLQTEINELLSDSAKGSKRKTVAVEWCVAKGYKGVDTDNVASRLYTFALDPTDLAALKASVEAVE